MTTIENINKVAGQQTLHPLICVVRKEAYDAEGFKNRPSDFYALTITHRDGNEIIHLSVPGERFEGSMEKGVYFHPDLLCDTPLEIEMPSFPRKCRCSEELTEDEIELIDGCFGKIDEELRHPIDRFSATILASHLSLLLNYCVKLCS